MTTYRTREYQQVITVTKDELANMHSAQTSFKKFWNGEITELALLNSLDSIVISAGSALLGKLFKRTLPGAIAGYLANSYLYVNSYQKVLISQLATNGANDINDKYIFLRDHPDYVSMRIIMPMLELEDNQTLEKISIIQGNSAVTEITLKNGGIITL